MIRGSLGLKQRMTTVARSSRTNKNPVHNEPPDPDEGIAEATKTQNQLASAWTSEAAVDQTRRRVESQAFGKLVDNLQLTWADIVSNLTRAEAAAGSDAR